MDRKLNISVSNRPQPDSMVSCRSLSLRERLLKRLLGEKCRMMVLIPGERVSAVSISEGAKGGG